MILARPLKGSQGTSRLLDGIWTRRRLVGDEGLPDLTQVLLEEVVCLGISRRLELFGIGNLIWLLWEIFGFALLKPKRYEPPALWNQIWNSNKALNQEGQASCSV